MTAAVRIPRSGRRCAVLFLVCLSLCAGAAFGQVPTPTSDNGALTPDMWRRDLNQLRAEVLDRDAAFTPQTRDAASVRLEILARGLDGMSDSAIAAEMASIVALSGNAHTRLDPLRNRGVWRRYPVRIWKFSDGWRIVAARPDQADLVGARILGFGDAGIEEVEERVRPLFAGNDPWAVYMATYALTSAEALEFAGAATPDQVQVRLETASGERSASLTAEPSEGRGRPEESWWYLADRHPRLPGWVHALSEAPLALQAPEVGYAYARCAGGIGYLRLNRTADQTGRPPLQQWGEALLARLEADPPGRLVIDLRFNTGGDLTKALPLIAGVIASEPGRRGALSVLVNGQTFSAGITQAAWLRQHSDARFVGERMGDSGSFWAEGDNVVLGHSGLTARYSTGAHHYLASPPPAAMRDRLFFQLAAPDLDPHQIVAWSWTDFRGGRDPALEAVAPGLTCPPGE